MRTENLLDNQLHFAPTRWQACIMISRIQRVVLGLGVMKFTFQPPREARHLKQVLTAQTPDRLKKVSSVTLWQALHIRNRVVYRTWKNLYLPNELIYNDWTMFFTADTRTDNHRAWKPKNHKKKFSRTTLYQWVPSQAWLHPFLYGCICHIHLITKLYCTLQWGEWHHITVWLTAQGYHWWRSEWQVAMHLQLGNVTEIPV